MEEKEKYELLSYVNRSSNRKDILSNLDEPKTPSELVDATGIKLSNVSRALGKLRDEELVKPINPNDRKYRYYKLTDKARKILKEIG